MASAEHIRARYHRGMQTLIPTVQYAVIVQLQQMERFLRGRLLAPNDRARHRKNTRVAQGRTALRANGHRITETHQNQYRQLVYLLGADNSFHLHICIHMDILDTPDLQLQRDDEKRNQQTTDHPAHIHQV